MLFILAWRNIWRSKRRTIIMVSAITFAVFLSSILQSFQKETWDKIIESSINSLTAEQFFCGVQNKITPLVLKISGQKEVPHAVKVARKTLGHEEFEIIDMGTMGGAELVEVYENFGIEPLLPFAFEFNIFFEQAIIMFIITSILAIYPLWKIYQLKPVEAMRA